MSRNFWILLIFAGMLTMTGCSTQSPPQPEQASPMKQGMVMSNKISQAYDWKIAESTQAIPTNKPFKLSWQIKDKESGIPVRDFKIVHEKLSHLVIVSQDLAVFQHIHPELVGPGKMTVETSFPKEGEYIMFLQFEDDKGEQTIRQEIQVGSAKSSTAKLVPDADQPKLLDGYTFKLTSYPTKANEDAMPTVNIEKDGKPVSNIESYLGAGGHAVVIGENTESFLHVHPMTKPIRDNIYESPITFHTVIPAPGLYKMWVQFQIAGKLETINFTFKVD